MKFINGTSGVFVDDTALGEHNMHWLGFEEDDKTTTIKSAQPDAGLGQVAGSDALEYGTGLLWAAEVASFAADADGTAPFISPGAVPGRRSTSRRS